VTDKQQLDLAYRNSFYVVTGTVPVEKIIQSKKSYFIHNPAVPLTKEIIKDMIDYFVNEEEYEKCIMLKEVINEI